jgi:hypothetical protein
MGIRKVIESDISGKLDADTVAFGIEDTWWEIDLTQQEREELEEHLRRYMDKGRRIGHKRPSRRKNYPNLSADEREEIRSWGEENGYDPALYGALATSLLKAYYEAHGDSLEARIDRDNEDRAPKA